MPTKRTRRKLKHANTKPDKPYPDFPLFAHASGQWAKTILGRHVYFGVWSDWETALAEYNKQKDYLHLGQTPPVEYTTLAAVLNAYMAEKHSQLELGKLQQRTFTEYENVCDTIAKLGRLRPFPGISREDLNTLKLKLCKGKGGRLRSPKRQRILLQHARQVFLFAAEELGIAIQYRRALRGPAARDIRKAKSAIGEQLFTADEINTLVKVANPQLKSMILLAINCGFGNEDCAELTIDSLDLATGWHNFPRPKTGVVRRGKLWRETVTALRAVIQNRPTPKNPEHNGLVFITKYGDGWSDGSGRNNPVSAEFRKLAKECKIYRRHVTTFYTLRRTFNTVGETANRPKALEFAMGHLPDANDMSAIYRQRTYDKPLEEIATQIRKWLRGSVSLV